MANGILKVQRFVKINQHTNNWNDLSTWKRSLNTHTHTHTHTQMHSQKQNGDNKELGLYRGSSKYEFDQNCDANKFHLSPMPIN